MPNIKPISDLRNYNEVLKYCENGESVFLTKNGHGKYVILDIAEYKRQQGVLKLLSKLNEAEDSIKNGEEWQSVEDLKKSLGV